jgi:hypothetical protein
MAFLRTLLPMGGVKHVWKNITIAKIYLNICFTSIETTALSNRGRPGIQTITTQKEDLEKGHWYSCKKGRQGRGHTI